MYGILVMKYATADIKDKIAHKSIGRLLILDPHLLNLLFFQC